MRNAKDKKALGTSLAELIEKFTKEDVIEEMEKEYASYRTQRLSLSLIKDNKYIKDVSVPEPIIERLAKTIKENGLYAPLIVHEAGQGYELVLGRKRLLAAKKAGITELPCIVGDFREEEILLILLADTRDQRESNIIEMALLFKALSDKFHYTQATLAEVSHQSRPQVTNTMRLLTLPKEVIAAIEKGDITYGHAKALVTLPTEEILGVAHRIVLEGLSVRDVEQLVRSKGAKSEDGSDEVARCAGAVKVQEKKTSITFSFENESQKKAFLEKLRGK